MYPWYRICSAKSIRIAKLMEIDRKLILLYAETTVLARILYLGHRIHRIRIRMTAWSLRTEETSRVTKIEVGHKKKLLQAVITTFPEILYPRYRIYSLRTRIRNRLYLLRRFLLENVTARTMWMTKLFEVW